MQNSVINIKEIKSTIIKGIGYQFLPLVLVGSITPWLKTIPGSEAIRAMLGLLVLILLLYGYGLCAKAADKYAKYKGYENIFYVYSILNIFGLSILFLLNNNNLTNNTNQDKNPLERFSIRAVFFSYFLIPLLLLPILLILAVTLVGFGALGKYTLNHKNFLTFSELVTALTFAWYFFKQLKIANIDFNRILGSLKSINFKLPLGLAIIQYLFAWGINSITLYGLSFIIPKYIEIQLNNLVSINWAFFAISALIYAPIMEELFFRGIIFQKIAIKQGFWRGLSISAILFAAIHFRFDLISLFIIGVISALLYFKTKQLATSIIYHFGYNLIVIVRKSYDQLVSNTDPSIQTTVVEYRQNFLDNFELYILLLAISIPYLSYFIYKNWPQKTCTERLPYFVNQEILN